MKKALFVFTRTQATDYRYVIPLPRELSEKANRFIQERLLAMQNGGADGTLYFFVCREDAVLLRAVDCGLTDAFGRPIFALEGIWVPAPDIRRFWLDLWAILPGFFALSPMHEALLDGDTIIESPSAEEFLRELYKAGQKKPGAHRLSDAMSHALRPIAFTYRAGRLIGDLPLPIVPRAPWTPEELRSCRVLLRFDRREKQAVAEAISFGEPEYVIARSEPIPADWNGWQLDRVKAAAQSLCDRLAETGWDWGGDEER